MLKNLKPLLLILFLSFLPFVSSFFNPLFPHTQDGLVHLARIAAYFKALSSGDFPVRWAGDLNYGFGMPVFIFMYPLPNLLSSLFIFITGSLVFSFKLVIFFSFILSGIFMYLFIKELFKNEKVAFMTTIFYQFAPFRLVEANIRGDIGEIYTYSFLPLLLWAILKNNILIIGLSSALLILSHNSISLVFYLMAVFFTFFFSKAKKNFASNILGLGWGLCISAFYWFPALFEHKYTLGNLFMKNVYQEYFPSLQKLFLPNFFNSSSLNMGDVPVQIGIFHVLILILSIVMFFERSDKFSFHSNNKRKILFFSCVISLLSLFFTQSLSTIFWEKISLLRQFQFPWRFVSVMVFTTALCSAVVFSSFKIFKNIKLLISISIIIIVSTLSYWWTPFGYDKINEQDYWNFPLTTTYYGETDLIWSEGPAKNYPKFPIELIGGKAEIKNYQRNNSNHSFTVLAKTPVQILDNTQYYPGWKVLNKSKEVEVEFQDMNHRGLITFRLPEGEHEVLVTFTKTKDRLISELISLIAFIFWFICVFFVIMRIQRKKQFPRNNVAM